MKCYSLTKAGLEPGIDPDSHLCIDADSIPGKLLEADMHLVPLLPYEQETPADTASLSLSFLIGRDPAETKGDRSPGILVTLDPGCWTQTAACSPLTLIDPCGSSGSVLVFVPAGSKAVLAGTGQLAGTYLSTDSKGVPRLEKMNRARVVLSLLGR